MERDREQTAAAPSSFRISWRRSSLSSQGSAPVFTALAPVWLWQCPIFRASLFTTSLHPDFTCTSLPRHRPEHIHNAVRYQIIGSK